MGCLALAVEPTIVGGGDGGGVCQPLHVRIGFRDSKQLLGFIEARINCIEAWSRMFLLVAVALAVLTQIGCALIEGNEGEQLLRRVRSRRRSRSELSLVRSIVELLAQGENLWHLLDHQCRLNLEAGL